MRHIYRSELVLGVVCLCIVFWYCLSPKKEVGTSNDVSTDSKGKLRKELPDFTRKEVTQIHDGIEILSKDTDALLHFLPNDTDRSQDIFPGVSRDISLLFSEDIVKKYDQFKGTFLKLQRREHVEGNTGKYPEQTLTYRRMVRMPFVRTVCETGFNAGHSTFTWLSENPHVRVYSFDIGTHKYSRPMAELLSSMFAGRLTLTWGDSKKTLPRFQQQNPDVRCDLIIVDGGHSFEVAQADVNNFRRMANRKNILVLDDYPTPDYDKQLGPVWEGGKKNKTIKENFRCNYRRFLPISHGFTVGQYLL